jgi:hypothetical protein
VASSVEKPNIGYIGAFGDYDGRLESHTADATVIVPITNVCSYMKVACPIVTEGSPIVDHEIVIDCAVRANREAIGIERLDGICNIDRSGSKESCAIATHCAGAPDTMDASITLDDNQVGLKPNPGYPTAISAISGILSGYELQAAFLAIES